MDSADQLANLQALLSAQSGGNPVLLEFRAGILEMKTEPRNTDTSSKSSTESSNSSSTDSNTVKRLYADPRKGKVQLQMEDGIMRMRWILRPSETKEQELMLFPNSAKFEFIPDSPSGSRCFVLRYLDSSARKFFYLQEPFESKEKDNEIVSKVNDLIDNPPPDIMGMQAAAGGAGQGVVRGSNRVLETPANRPTQASTNAPLRGNNTSNTTSNTSRSNTSQNSATISSSTTVNTATTSTDTNNTSSQSNPTTDTSAANTAANITSTNTGTSNESTNNMEDDHVEDEEALLQQALQMSMNTASTNASDNATATGNSNTNAMSDDNDNEEDERLLQQAIAMSMNAAGTDTANTSTTSNTNTNTSTSSAASLLAQLLVAAAANTQSNTAGTNNNNLNSSEAEYPALTDILDTDKVLAALSEQDRQKLCSFLPTSGNQNSVEKLPTHLRSAQFRSTANKIESLLESDSFLTVMQSLGLKIRPNSSIGTKEFLMAIKQLVKEEKEKREKK